MPVTLQDFPENQETLYGAIIDSIVQTLDVVIEQEKSHVKKRQKDGINALRQTQAWQNYGRPATKLPENYAVKSGFQIPEPPREEIQRLCEEVIKETEDD